MKDTARTFAIEAHGDQKYGHLPYAYHLDAVARIVSELSWGFEVEPISEYKRGLVQRRTDLWATVAYLHDVLEDTATTPNQLLAAFGGEVLKLVEICTDCEGPNRRERKYLTNLKLAAVEPQHNVALIVKAADRLANIREGGKNGMYRREHVPFREAAYRAGLCDPIWDEMELLLSAG